MMNILKKLFQVKNKASYSSAITYTPSEAIKALESKAKTNAEQRLLEDCQTIEKILLSIEEIIKSFESINDLDEKKKVLTESYSTLEKILKPIKEKQKIILEETGKQKIEEVLFSFNLLALETAILAARKGPKGKKIEIIAEHLRNLANQSINLNMIKGNT